MRDVEIDGWLAGQTHFHFEDDFVNGARGYVARDEVAVFRIPLFEKIKALGFGNIFATAFIARLFRNRRRVHLRREPIRSSGGICLRRESRWDELG